MAKLFDRYEDCELAEMRRLREGGATYPEIARVTGRSRQAVAAKIREVGGQWSIPPKRDVRAIGETRPRRLDDAGHVRAVLKQGGFCWLRPQIAQRFYELESAS